MHKAGGIVALIAGIFSIFAMFFGSFVAVAFTVLDGSLGANDAAFFFISGIFVSGVVIILSAIILNTSGRLPGIILIVFSVFAIYYNLGSGFSSICLVFAIIGGLMALSKGV